MVIVVHPCPRPRTVPAFVRTEHCTAQEPSPDLGELLHGQGTGLPDTVVVLQDVAYHPESSAAAARRLRSTILHASKSGMHLAAAAEEVRWGLCTLLLALRHGNAQEGMLCSHSAGVEVGAEPHYSQVPPQFAQVGLAG